MIESRDTNNAPVSLTAEPYKKRQLPEYMQEIVDAVEAKITRIQEEIAKKKEKS